MRFLRRGTGGQGAVGSWAGPQGFPTKGPEPQKHSRLGGWEGGQGEEPASSPSPQEAQSQLAGSATVSNRKAATAHCSDLGSFRRFQSHGLLNAISPRSDGIFLKRQRSPSNFQRTIRHPVRKAILEFHAGYQNFLSSKLSLTFSKIRKHLPHCPFPLCLTLLSARLLLTKHGRVPTSASRQCQRPWARTVARVGQAAASPLQACASPGDGQRCRTRENGPALHLRKQASQEIEEAGGRVRASQGEV